MIEGEIVIVEGKKTMSDIKFEIVKKVGVLSKSEKGCPLRGGALMAPRYWNLRPLHGQSATRDCHGKNCLLTPHFVQGWQDAPRPSPGCYAIAKTE